MAHKKSSMPKTMPKKIHNDLKERYSYICVGTFMRIKDILAKNQCFRIQKDA